MFKHRVPMKFLVGSSVLAAGAVGLVALKKSGILDYVVDDISWFIEDMKDDLASLICGCNEEDEDFDDEGYDPSNCTSSNKEPTKETVADTSDTKPEAIKTETHQTVETEDATEPTDEPEIEAETTDYTIKAFAVEMFNAFQKFCQEHPVDNYVEHYKDKVNQSIEKARNIIEEAAAEVEKAKDTENKTDADSKETKE